MHLTVKHHSEHVDSTRFWGSKLDYKVEAKTLIKLEKFNIEQKEFFHAVMSGINGDGGLFCLDAPGGTGKTFVLGALLSAVRSDGHTNTKCLKLH